MKAAARVFLFLCLLASSASPVLADSPAELRPYVTTAGYGSYVFKMLPATWRREGERYVKDREAFGVAYELDEKGDLIELWRTEGWYAFQVFLSDDCRYLVRMGVWPTIKEEYTDVAVAFYDRGKLVKSYEVRDLLKRPHLIEYSTSHYDWKPQKQTVPNGIEKDHLFHADYPQGDCFHLVMIDKTAYRFDLATGDIISTETDPGAQSDREIWEAEEAVDQKKGVDLLRDWPLRGRYEAAFAISEVKADYGWTSGVWFQDTQWNANFVPRKTYKRPCWTDAVFLVGDKGIVADITPEEIDESITKVLEHPFVQDFFKRHGAEGIRQRITGDRLHWDTPELDKWLTQARGKGLEKESPRYWSGFIIDADNPRYTSIYHNSKTGELLYEDESTPWPHTPVLLNAKGERVPAVGGAESK